MSRKDLLKWMHVIRRDLGNLVVHWTRARWNWGKIEADAFQVLCEILKEGRLRGSHGGIKGSYRCVCFTEAPVSELATLFKISELTPGTRYEPFGIAVSKIWLFEQGGRPVIYQPAEDFELLPEDLRWRHCRYELCRDPEKTIDFTWEREWRIQTEALELEPKETLVIVPTRQHAYDAMINFLEEDEERYPEPKWMTVSLDYFGLPGEWKD